MNPFKLMSGGSSKRPLGSDAADEPNFKRTKLSGNPQGPPPLANPYGNSNSRPNPYTATLAQPPPVIPPTATTSSNPYAPNHYSANPYSPSNLSTSSNGSNNSSNPYSPSSPTMVYNNNNNNNSNNTNVTGAPAPPPAMPPRYNNANTNTNNRSQSNSNSLNNSIHSVNSGINASSSSSSSNNNNSKSKPKIKIGRSRNNSVSNSNSRSNSNSKSNSVNNNNDNNNSGSFTNEVKKKGRVASSMKSKSKSVNIVRRDLFQDNLDEKYRNTLPTSCIPAPQISPQHTYHNWLDNARKALANFQRDNDNHNNSDNNNNNSKKREPTDPVLRILHRHTVQLDPNCEHVRKVQEEILELIYCGNLRHKLKLFRAPYNARNLSQNINPNNINNALFNDAIENSDGCKQKRIDLLKSRNQRKYYDFHYSKLPGPLPKSVTRDVLNEFLLNKSYYVAEKSDGIRFMLYIRSKCKSSYLIDRKFDIFDIIHPFYITAFSDFIKNGGALFDGELMLKYEKINFKNFDYGTKASTTNEIDNNNNGSNNDTNSPSIFDEDNTNTGNNNNEKTTKEASKTSSIESSLGLSENLINEIKNVPLILKPNGQLIFLAFDCIGRSGLSFSEESSEVRIKYIKDSLIKFGQSYKQRCQQVKSMRAMKRKQDNQDFDVNETDDEIDLIGEYSKPNDNIYNINYYPPILVEPKMHWVAKEITQLLKHIHKRPIKIIKNKFNKPIIELNNNNNNSDSKCDDDNSNDNSYSRSNSSHSKRHEEKEAEDEIEMEYIYDDNYRVNKNDGLVFTPRLSNYLSLESQGNDPLLKWKYLEKNTIDLKVKLPFIFRNQLKLYTESSTQQTGDKKNININYGSSAMGPRNIEYNSGIKQSKFDTIWDIIDLSKHKDIRRKFELLKNEMQLYESSKNINGNKFIHQFIIEFEYNFNKHTWYPVTIRPDKTTPNFITVCTDTLRVMMDHVTLTEIINVCQMQDENVKKMQDNDEMANASNGYGNIPMHSNNNNNNMHNNMNHNNNGFNHRGGGGYGSPNRGGHHHHHRGGGGSYGGRGHGRYNNDNNNNHGGHSRGGFRGGHGGGYGGRGGRGSPRGRYDARNNNNFQQNNGGYH